MVDFLVTCLLRNALFSRSAVIRTFALAFSNFMQPTRTRRFPIKLSIKKRIFWSICGRPGFCSHIFAKLCSRPELADFLLNCLLRNAFFGRSAVIRAFAINRLELVELLLNCQLRSAFSDRPAVIRTFAVRFLGSRFELVDFLLNCLLRNAFFLSICGHPDFAITFLQFWATNSNSSVSYYTVH